MTDDDTSTQQDKFGGLVLPEEGVTDLTDKLTEYMTEIELGGMPDVLGQVLDDFIDQAGGMPEDLRDEVAFEQITANQLAVTLAYQLGRLEGRSPQVVWLMIQQIIQKWGSKTVVDTPDISDEDLEHPKVLVYPKLRRLEYVEPEAQGER